MSERLERNEMIRLALATEVPPLEGEETITKIEHISDANGVERRVEFVDRISTSLPNTVSDEE